MLIRIFSACTLLHPFILVPLRVHTWLIRYLFQSTEHTTTTKPVFNNVLRPRLLGDIRAYRGEREHFDLSAAAAAGCCHSNEPILSVMLVRRVCVDYSNQATHCKVGCVKSIHTHTQTLVAIINLASARELGNALHKPEWMKGPKLIDTEHTQSLECKGCSLFEIGFILNLCRSPNTERPFRQISLLLFPLSGPSLHRRRRRRSEEAKQINYCLRFESASTNEKRDQSEWSRDCVELVEDMAGTICHWPGLMLVRMQMVQSNRSDYS